MLYLNSYHFVYTNVLILYALLAHINFICPFTMLYTDYCLHVWTYSVYFSILPFWYWLYVYCFCFYLTCWCVSIMGWHSDTHSVSSHSPCLPLFVTLYFPGATSPVPALIDYSYPLSWVNLKLVNKLPLVVNWYSRAWAVTGISRIFQRVNPAYPRWMG